MNTLVMYPKLLNKGAAEESVTEMDSNNDAENESFKEYNTKIYSLKSQLTQIHEGCHPELCKATKNAEAWLADQKFRIQILHENRIDEIHNQYEQEIETCKRDCNMEKKRIQEYLISLCEDLKRRLEHDKKNIELTPSGDVLELKPTVTRKLRRRNPENIPSNGTKFGYWGDILLNTPSFNLPSNSVKSQIIHEAISLSSIQPVSSTATSPQPSKINDGETENFNQIKSTNNNNSQINGNIFGSLGVNVEDGSLITHLLASLTASSENNTLSASGALFASAINQSASLTNSNSATVGQNNLNIIPSSLGFSAAVGGVNTGMSSTLQPIKRRKQHNLQPFTQLSLLLPENDIYSDLTLIHRSCGKPPSSSGTKKHGNVSANFVLNCDSSSRVSGSSPTYSRSTDAVGRDLNQLDGSNVRRKDALLETAGIDSVSPPLTPSIWIDDGRLYCGQICFQQGASVYIEGHGCSGTIISIRAHDITIKRNSDHGIIRLTVQQLKHGRYSLVMLKRR